MTTTSKPPNNQASIYQRLLSSATDKTLFDWLQVFGSVGIPFFLLVLTIVQAWSAGENRKQDLRIADENRQEEIMSKYLEQITELIINENLGLNSARPGVKDIARALTQNAARRLDSDGKGKLLKLLYEANLIGGGCEFNLETQQYEECTKSAVVDLREISLDEISSSDEETFDPNKPLSLPGVDLDGALLPGAELPRVALINANMYFIELTEANLAGGNLTDANLERARLRRAKLDKATLGRAELIRADLREASLRGALLKKANLQKASLSKTNLQGADLTGASLEEANLQGADLTGASLEEANFQGAEYNVRTKFPAGFDPASKGMILKAE